MELNPSTFLLEILNFAVLVWILQRFLYKPVLSALARRQAQVDRTVARADALQAEAAAAKAAYEDRLADWEKEKQAEREALRRELAQHRDKALAELDSELAETRERAKVLDAKLAADQLSKLQTTCLDQAARFAAKLVGELATPELEARLIDLALERLTRLPAERVDAIRAACEDSPEEARLTTAYPLPEAARATLAAALRELLGTDVIVEFREDPALLAGLRIQLGPWLFQANLADELKAFADAA